MTRSIHVLSIFLAAWLLATTTMALPDAAPEIETRFLEAGDDLIVPAAGGWPLTLVLTLNEAKLLGIGGSPGAFPSLVETGFFIFDDPDGCPSWDDRGWQERHFSSSDAAPSPMSAYRRCTNPPPLPWPRDEKLLEITPGRSALPASGECARLEILSFDFAAGTNTAPTSVGPCAGKDGGYGPNHRLPGLMVVADHGPGVVTDQLFNRPTLLAARNLAGFFDSVAYTLKDARAKTSVSVHINVPRALFSAVVQVDDLPGDGCGGGPGPMVRVDGGLATCALDPTAVLSRPVTVRAFVVNGQAPAMLVDGNHDGMIDLRDAAVAGLELLSNETQIRFRMVHHEPHNWLVFFDLDGNGEAGIPPVSPSGPAELTNPPR